MGLDILTLAAAKAGSGGSGGSTSKYAQPEWGVEQNGVLLPETTADVIPDMSAAMIKTPFNAMPEDGKTYAINYNDASYECLCTLADIGGSAAYVLGNGAAMGFDVPASDAPFVMAVTIPGTEQYEEMPCMFVPLDGSASCTVSMSGEIVHTIPSNYVGGTEGVFVVTTDAGESGSSGSFTCNRTFDEIIKAISQGKAVYAETSGYGKIPVTRLSYDQVDFAGITDVSASYVFMIWLRIGKDGATQYERKTINITT